MSDSADDDLQFDRVEAVDPEQTDDAPTPCFACGQPIAGQYFDINDNVACPRCRDAVEDSLTGGSGGQRLVVATVAGSAAAAAGAGLYFAVQALTGYQIGLIAIVVGLMVGAAVRWGAQRRGGWGYQTLAILLTYCAIVGTNLPGIIHEFANSEPPAVEDSALSDEPTLIDDPTTTGIEIALGIIMLVVIVLICPFLQFSPIYWLIIAFALYEAWKMNKRATLVIRGPFQVGAPPTGETTAL